MAFNYLRENIDRKFKESNDIVTKIPEKYLNMAIGKKGYDEYAERLVKKWNVDDFVGFIKGQTTSNENEIAKTAHPLAKAIFPSLKLPEEESGLNNDRYYKKYGSWASKLYDIWIEIQKVNNLK